MGWFSQSQDSELRILLLLLLVLVVSDQLLIVMQHSAGVRAGDVITAIDGNAVTSSADVYKAVNSGKPLRLTVLRSDSPTPVSVSVTPEAVQ